MANLNVKVGLDRSGFQTGLAAMENAATGFGRNLGGLLAGAFSFTAITQQITSAISQAGRLQDLSDTFGISAESLQRIGNAAAESGGSIEDVGRALAKIGVGAQQAFAENKQLASAFAAIGVKGKDLISLSPEQLFYRLSAALKDGSLAGKDMAVAKELLGRGFATLMPVLKMTEEQIRAVGEAAGIMSDDAVAKLDSFGDSWGRLSNKVKVKAAEIIDASIRLGEELMANPTGIFGDWQEIEKRIDARQRKDKEARDALQKVREMPGDAGTDSVATENKKVAEDTDAFLRNLQTKREVDEIARARELERTRRQLKEETAQRERDLAEENARAIANIEDIQAERAGPAAETRLARERTREAGQLARQTGSVQDALAAEQQAARLQRLLESSFQAQGIGPNASRQMAFAEANRIRGALPEAPPAAGGPSGQPLDARTFETTSMSMVDQFLQGTQTVADALQQSINRMPAIPGDVAKDGTVDEVRARVKECVDRLDKILRATGTFGE